MRGIRDGPGKHKAAVWTAFFAGKKRNVPEHRACITADKKPLEKIRRHLYEMMTEADAEISGRTREEIYLQIDEMLHTPMLIWRNGVCYRSWAECLGYGTNCYGSSRGDAEVSPFLVEEKR